MKLKRTDYDWVCAGCELQTEAAYYGSEFIPLVKRCEYCGVAICAHHMFKEAKSSNNICTGCKSHTHGMFEDGSGRLYASAEDHWKEETREKVTLKWELDEVEVESKK